MCIQTGCKIRFTVMLLLLTSLVGCAPGGSGGTGSEGESNENAGSNGGDVPPAQSRSDGATLLFSPRNADNPNASVQNAAFSPDGDRIVFTRFANGYNIGPAELWIMDVDGSDPHRISPVEDQDSVNVPGSAWNAVRNEIVFASDREQSDDIWAIRPDGSGMRRITEHVPPPFWIEPVWSPDGEWIVFEADTQATTELEQRGTIFKVRFDGTEVTQLTKLNGADFDDRLPNWSPDGERILFQRRLPDDEETEGDNWDIYVIDIDGGNPVNVSNARNLFNTDNSWSSNSEWIASSSGFQPSGVELPHPNIIGFFVPDPGSGDAPAEPVRITFEDGHEDGAPSVSPDGQSVAFESHSTADEQSPSDLWIIAVPDPLKP